MDPNECWKQMLEAVDANENEMATESANSLLQWLYDGGFSPTSVASPTWHFSLLPQ